MITFEDFRKLDLRIGKIESARPVEGTDRLLRLSVSLGGEKRQLVAGIAGNYTPASLEGKLIVVVANLEPKTLRGVESQGMLLAADTEGGPVLLQPDSPDKEGTKVR
jgi:methionine--tRNA ligase beta chain